MFDWVDQQLNKRSERPRDSQDQGLIGVTGSNYYHIKRHPGVSKWGTWWVDKCVIRTQHLYSHIRTFESVRWSLERVEQEEIWGQLKYIRYNHKKLPMWIRSSLDAWISVRLRPWDSSSDFVSHDSDFQRWNKVMKNTGAPSVPVSFSVGWVKRGSWVKNSQS